MSVTLEESYVHCRQVARTRARNFYYSFVLLSKPRRDAMCALYTFNRVCDDISDSPEQHGYGSPREAIADWENQLSRALNGRIPDHPCWPAFRDVVKRFGIPHHYFRDMIAGVGSDLEPRCVETFDELYQYCYRVASVVGLSVLHVLGFESEQAPALAEKCGIAFQLTNILRDVREDAVMGRVYLPAEDLRRFDVDPAELSRAGTSESFRRLMEFEARRARNYYREAAPLVGLVNKSSRGSLRTLIGIYSRLLARIEASDYDVRNRRIRVPAWEKLLILLRGTLR